MRHIAFVERHILTTCMPTTESRPEPHGQSLICAGEHIWFKSSIKYIWEKVKATNAVIMVINVVTLQKLVGTIIKAKTGQTVHIQHISIKIKERLFEWSSWEETDYLSAVSSCCDSRDSLLKVFHMVSVSAHISSVSKKAAALYQHTQIHKHSR